MKHTSVVPRFFIPEAFAPGDQVTVGEDAARHMRVIRLGAGARVTLLNGNGVRAEGVLRTLAKRNATVEVGVVATVAPLPEVHMLVPIADRDRMLWLAEKCAELGLSSWRPVMWKRSRSVSPRGEGSGFQARVRARMASALEQSGSTWLPVTYPDATVDRAIASLPSGCRYALDASGVPVARAMRELRSAPVAVALGPEGGFEEGELRTLQDAGFERVGLGAGVLRFETAGIVALAHVRAALAELETTG